MPSHDTKGQMQKKKGLRNLKQQYLNLESKQCETPSAQLLSLVAVQC